MWRNLVDAYDLKSYPAGCRFNSDHRYFFTFIKVLVALDGCLRFKKKRQFTDDTHFVNFFLIFVCICNKWFGFNLMK